MAWKNLQSYLLASLITTLLYFIPSVALAQDVPSTEPALIPVQVTLNGAEIPGSFLSEESSVMTPMRLLFEAIGADVFWDDSSKTARAFFMGNTVTLRTDSPIASRNGAQVLLNAPARIVNDRLYVPLRFVSESLGAKVTWNGVENPVDIVLKDSKGTPVRLLTNVIEEAAKNSSPEPEDGSLNYSDEEITLLAKVINAEAYSEPYEGKVAVGAVIVNRVKSNRFKNSIKDVISSGCQFTVVCNGKIDRLDLLEDSRQAALEALRGADPTKGALYFTNLGITKNPDFWARLTQTVKIGNHTFFKP